VVNHGPFLQVKVGFGEIWKESLGELSGGQRSLVALSLILAMLLFKPAPIYILDEVDAALDLSHTQNIGNMLKAHFKASQVSASIRQLISPPFHSAQTGVSPEKCSLYLHRFALYC